MTIKVLVPVIPHYTYSVLPYCTAIPPSTPNERKEVIVSCLRIFHTAKLTGEQQFLNLLNSGFLQPAYAPADLNGSYLHEGVRQATFLADKEREGPVFRPTYWNQKWNINPNDATKLLISKASHIHLE